MFLIIYCLGEGLPSETVGSASFGHTSIVSANAKCYVLWVIHSSGAILDSFFSSQMKKKLTFHQINMNTLRLSIDTPKISSVGSLGAFFKRASRINDVFSDTLMPHIIIA